MEKLLILELNELCPTLMDKYISQGYLPNFEKLRNCSKLFVTETEDEELQPWVQWVSYHLGRPYSHHQIFSLDEGHLVKEPMIWDTLAKKDMTSLVFGAMNTNFTESEKIEFMPDAWSSKVKPNTSKLDKIHTFVQKMVQEHTNPEKALSLKELAGYLLYFTTNGLRFSTLLKFAGQIIKEKTLRNDIKWKRACLFDLLAWDLFKSQYIASNADVGVFFGNSTAHLQHRFWRYMAPNDFQVKPDQHKAKSYEKAILFGYQNMDEMVGELLKSRKFSDTSIILVTALSQHANPARVNSEPEVAYRPKNFDVFLEWCGIDNTINIEPLMTHLFWLDFKDKNDLEKSAQQLEKVQYRGKPCLSFEIHDLRIKTWCNITKAISEDSVISNHKGENQAFLELFSTCGESILDGSHNKAGIFWISNRKRIKSEVSNIPLTLATKLTIDAALNIKKNHENTSFIRQENFDGESSVRG